MPAQTAHPLVGRRSLLALAATGALPTALMAQRTAYPSRPD